MNSQLQHMENQINDLRARQMTGERVRQIARYVALEILQDFVQGLKQELAAGATVTPEFIEDAYQSMRDKP